MFRTAFHSNTTAIVSIPVLLLLLLVSPGCKAPASSPALVDGTPMWPPPPAQPRIIYEKSVEQPSDLGIRRSWWRKVGRFIVGRDEGEINFSKPTGLCLDESGNLCVADTGSRRIYFLDAIHKRCKSWDHIGKIAFSSPVAVAKQGGVFYVADSGLGKIIAFDEAGKLIFTITDDLKRPSGVGIAGDTLWVVDSARHRIEIYDLQGRYLRGFGQRGAESGAFNFPTHLSQVRDGSDSVYITDAMNFRIQKVNRDGEPVQIIGSIGDVSGSFSRPKGVATDSEGNVYVVDALFDNVQIFDNEGRFLMHFGGSGSEPGSFWLPSGIAVDALDRIWVADSYNSRIQVFKRVGDQGDD